MKHIINDEFAFMVLEAVNEIPEGKVASYGQIAKLIGYSKRARHVGKVLSNVSHYGNYPCHRVLHSDGSLVEGWIEQEQLLIQEGVVFKRKGYVNMKESKWGI